MPAVQAHLGKETQEAQARLQQTLQQVLVVVQLPQDKQ
jgi:hypothetical protein